jgi:hypothetical protein
VAQVLQRQLERAGHRRPASPILSPRPGLSYLTHGDAAYSTYLGRYLLCAYNQSLGRGIYLAASDDGVHFDPPGWIQTNRNDKDSLSPYETIVNVDGTDNGVVGQVFYVYFGYRNRETLNDPNSRPYEYRWLYRQKVTLHKPA